MAESPGRPTVRSLLDAKGRRKLVLTTAFDRWTARAAQDAGVDMIVTSARNLEQLRGVVDQVRRGAPHVVLGAGLPPIDAYTSDAQALRVATELFRDLSVDVIYSGGLVVDRFAALARQRIPCVGHVGYVPSQSTWFGGPRAVGKDWREAIRVYDHVVALAAAGVIGVELELVPSQVAAEITRRVRILTFSMGSGPHCDGQVLFASDLLGTNLDHYPRHSTTYVRLFDLAVDAFGRFGREVRSGEFPTPAHAIVMAPDQHERFLTEIEGRPLPTSRLRALFSADSDDVDADGELW